MISLYDLEDFWFDNPALEKALLDIVDVTREPSSKTVGGAQIDIGWFDFGGVRSVGVDITHPQFYLNFETIFEPARVAGDKYRVTLTDGERYQMLQSFDGPKGTNTFEPLFKWLAESTKRPTYPARIIAAAAQFTQIPRLAA